MRVPEVIRKFFNITDSQQDRVIRIVNDMANLNDQLAGTEPAVCSKWHCTDGFTKAGFECNSRLSEANRSGLGTH